MSQLNDAAVDAIARRVLEHLRGAGGGSAARSGGMSSSGGAPAAAAPLSTTQMETVSRAGSLPAGVFRSIDECVKAARTAFLQLSQLGLEKRKEIIASIRKSMLEHAVSLARDAHTETGLGRVEDKIAKNTAVTERTPGPEVLTPVTWTGDYGLTLTERAPYGVIAAITPTTNPTSTIICNTIGMVAAGNTVAFNVHPNAKRVSCRNVGLINEAIMKAGGPPNVVTAMSDPTIASAQELMTHPGVRLLVVTGGGGVVKAAMSSGKRAICAGPGNPPIVVDETADIDHAARCIVKGASLDNNIICVDEKQCFVVETVADKLIKAMTQHNAILLTPPQARAVEKVVFEQIKGPRQAGVINHSMIGKNPSVILEKIGLRVPDTVRLAFMEVDQNHPLIWSEQLMPVFPVCRVRNADEGIDLAFESEHGFGHSAGMHSLHLGNLSRMAKVMNCSIFVKNGCLYQGLGIEAEGYCSFSIASPTGEGLTGPISFSRERRCVLKDHFRIV